LEVAHGEEEEHGRARRKESFFLEGIGDGKLRSDRVGFTLGAERIREDAEQKKLGTCARQFVPRLFGSSQKPASFRPIEARGDEIRVDLEDLTVPSHGPLQVEREMERDRGLEGASLLGREDRRQQKDREAHGLSAMTPVPSLRK
jgi:hypothetical protein